MAPEDSGCTSPWEWGFQPGDRVRIVDGTFLGHDGEVQSHEQAQRRLRKAGQPTWRAARETIWVLLELFGKPVVIQFQPNQIVHM
jgi:transcription antitermination factor NusG